MRNSSRLIAAFAAVCAAGAGAAAIAADTATQITVAPSATLMPGDSAPGDAPGVRAIRRGKPIPSGYRLLAQKVTNTRGIPSAAAALSFTCPGTTRLKTFIVSGNVGFSSISDYRNHKQTWVRTYPAKKGQTTTGIIYAVCR